MKKFLLSFLMLIAAVPLWAHDFEVDGIYYNYISETEKTVSVTHYGDIVEVDYAHSYYGSVIIPESVTYNKVTYSVTSIGYGAFYGCIGLTEVTIPNSVTEIGMGAFFGSYGLTSITIPNSVTSIGESAFAGCYGLTSIAIPNSVTSIGESAFSGCSGLTEFTIPNSVTSIGGWAFSGCSGLTSITIPNSVTEIGDDTFEGCSGLTSITIPNSVTKIGKGAFEGCSGLTSITIPNSVTEIKESTFSGCSGLTSIAIPNSVYSIGKGAFKNCINLTSMTIPAKVSTIGRDAFTGCWSLESLTIEDGYVTLTANDNFKNSNIRSLYLGRNIDSWFSGCISLATVTIGNYVTQIGSAAFADCSLLKSLTIQDGYSTLTTNGCFENSNITSLYLGRNIEGTHCFSGCESLATVTIGNSVTEIGTAAFADCASLKSLTIQDAYIYHTLSTNGCFENSNITSLYLGRNIEGTHCFSGCESLATVTIGNSVTEIGESAFHGCYGLTSITIPNSVTEIASRAFSGCYGLTEITIGNSVTSIGDDAFEGCSGLTSITIPNSVTEIASRAFFGCSGLTSMTIPSKVSTIGRDAFTGCSGLKSLTIEDSEATLTANGCFKNSTITSLYLGKNIEGTDCFSDCDSLATVTIGNYVTQIGSAAFTGCSGLKSLTIEDSEAIITANGCFENSTIRSLYLGRNIDGWFRGCESLAKVTIGNSVTSIASRAFQGCTGLTFITIPNSVTSIGDDAFKGCSGLTKVTIPNSVIEIGNYAFEDCSRLPEVTIPNSVTEIGEGAFIGCSGLIEVTIPNSVIQIGNYAFQGCSGLTSITIPNSVTSIGEKAFYFCSGLTEVTIGNKVETIGGWAFGGCNNIVTIYSLNTTAPKGAPFDAIVKQSATLNIPSSAIASYQSTDGWKDFTNIHELALNGTYDFEFDGLYYRIISMTDLTAKVAPKDFEYNSYSGNVVIPNVASYRNREFKVIGIESTAFKGCVNLNSITIPANVETIDKNAFAYCYSLKSLTIEDSGATLTTNGCFKNSTITSLYLGRNIDGWFSGCESLAKVTIGNSVTEIGDDAFKGCSGLTEVTIPNSVTEIGAWALSDCSGLTEVTIGNSVTSIGESAFRDCSGLTEVTIGNSVTSIGERAFLNCYVLTEVTIGNKVKTIGVDAFTRCWGLKSLTIEDSDATLTANGCFQNSNITSLYLGRNIDSWFSGCESLTTVTIGNSVTEIGESAFAGCKKITDIVIPEMVETIGIGVFDGCSALSNLIIKSSEVPLKISRNTFSYLPLTSLYLGRTLTNTTAPFKNITTLTELTLGNGMGSLQSGAFEGCTSIKLLNIEGGESEITINATFAESPIEKLHIGRTGTYAFNNSTTLKEVSVGDNVTSIPENAFRGCSNITTAKLGANLKTIGSGAFSGCSSLMNVYSSSLTPATGAVFDNRTYLQGTLYVVKGYANVYATANGWKEFWEIIDNLPFEVNGLWYNIDENGNANVVGNPSGDSYVGQVTIPANVEFDGVSYPVTSIDAEAFANAINVTSITIEDSNQPLTIGAPATAISTMSNDQAGTFEACLLDSVYVGRNLNYATAPFANIASLKKVAIGASVTSMGGAMFDGCENINEVHSLNTTPPAEAQFDEKVYNNAMLYIEQSAKDDYATADGWKEFVNVATQGSSMIEDIDVEDGAYNISIIAVNGEIIVNGAEDAQIAIYNINGSMIYQGVNRPVAVGNKGVYVIIVNNKAFKVAL